ncbi:hypothetical protein K0U91_08280 [Chryseobacterium chendengshani]|uniref:hypothetical protein n=1 Tax=Chryseobacterium sp. LJ668 TaxID=2864040 RepID=UPI001C689222|nr:hypothetical protein [Chryseobacterium sp. LJ668]MBW8524688.1 hypothetical protein [Chryseobacterium sp. LJ668]QYK15086.1 hypothetical protein K0U91_08280 [Chryseobacterium sp. LJ668]
MKSFIRIISAIYLLGSAISCKSYPMGVLQQSDVNRNSEELQKRHAAEREKTEVSHLNNFGKPPSK